MGKKQHSKDRLFITATEWKSAYGGHKKKLEAQYRRLPFDRCALSFTPFENPVCTVDGIVFDIVNIVPYLKQHKKNPVTGAPLAVKDLIKLHFHKNTEGNYCCPVTYKVFTNNSHIVAIRTSGNVFSYETIEELNIKPKHWEDLVSGEAFTRADIITIQDPNNSTSREIDKFHHVQQVDEGEVEEDKLPTIKQNEMMKKVLSAVGPSKQETSEASAPLYSSNPKNSLPTKDGPRSRHTSHHHAASFTSTALAPITKNERALLTPEQIREQMYESIRGTGAKSFIRMHTTLGNLNIQIECDLVPRTAHNFLTLCAKGYYNGVIFHRLIPDFMIQGGDPTGTGRGGESAWGKEPIKDELTKELRHDKRGILSMANSGPDTNRSQFFITFAPCPHLNDKHSVFGRVVGGMETLDAMEAVPTVTKGNIEDRPKQEIKITEISIYQNPFDEPFEAKDELEMAANKKKPEDPKESQEAQEKRRWFSNPAPSSVQPKSSGIGKYINKAKIVAQGKPSVDPDHEPSAKKQKTASSFGNFSSF